MIILESTPGGDLEKARQYSLLGLERATRPRGYEVALVHAGRLLQDHTEAIKALQLAMELLSHPVQIPVDGDPFPFATKLRWVYKYQTLETVAAVFYERAQRMSNPGDARSLLKIRNEVLNFRRSLKSHLFALGMKPGEEELRLFAPGTIDEIMFQLLDPEAVLEEEEMMKIAPSTSSRTVDLTEPSMRMLSLREGLAAVSRLSGK
jgi:hypothetical protein